MFSHPNTFGVVRFPFLISVQSFAWDFFVSTHQSLPRKSTDWHSLLVQTSHVKPAKQLVIGLSMKSIIGGLATSVAWENYDKLTDSIAAGRQAMHVCMGVVYQNTKPGEASAPLELAAIDNKDAFPGAFHSQQQLAGRPSCFWQYRAVISSSLQIALKKRRHHFFIQNSF